MDCALRRLLVRQKSTRNDVLSSLVAGGLIAFMSHLCSIAPAAAAEGHPNRVAPGLPGSPFGIAWYIIYGYLGVPALNYSQQLKELGADFTKIYLFWQQVEPQKGSFDWTAVEAFARQLESPESGLIALFSASRWATEKSSAMLPPSAAKNLDDYYYFVFEVVQRCHGRVRYWQNDSEPSNPVFWASTKEQFAAQTKVFFKAVKDADPNAVVVLGGYDGVFIPPNLPPAPGRRTTPLPHQQVGLDFFDYILKECAGYFDLFDLRLYADPATIVPRIEYMRQRMGALGQERPIICTEYGGPGLFEFPENRKYIHLIDTWSQAVVETDDQGLPSSSGLRSNQIEQLYAEVPSLAPQMQMFMQGCSAELDEKYQRIQSRGLVMRNLFALSAGVQKMIYWELPVAPGKRDDLMNLMYGKIGLLRLEGGVLKKWSATAEAYARMTRSLAGLRRVTRVLLPDQPSLCLFKVDRGPGVETFVVWEQRDAFSGEDAPAVEHAWPWSARNATATDVFGKNVPVTVAEGRLRVPVSVDPLYINPSPQ